MANAIQRMRDGGGAKRLREGQGRVAASACAKLCGAGPRDSTQATEKSPLCVVESKRVAHAGFARALARSVAQCAERVP